MIEPMFLKSYFQEKMWGGTRLKSEFGYQIPSDHTGECWAISAHPHGCAVVENGAFAGMKLDQVWQEHREVFGDAQGKVFPLLTKILDAHKDLSVQVHPDDPYAAKHEHELGKTECWYIIAADPDAKLIYGHTAKTRQELAEMIKQQQWDKLLRYVPVKAGDFFYVPSGTIHALGAGIMALETQQSSDTTYRVYDFDRVDPSTHQKRQLHLQQSIAVTNVPHVDPQLQQKKYRVGDAQVTQFAATDFFAVYRWDLTAGGTANFVRKTAPYTLVSVLNGSGQLQVADKKYPLKKGQHLILPFAVKSWQLSGQLEIIASEPGKKA